jgi:hypothetical protein
MKEVGNDVKKVASNEAANRNCQNDPERTPAQIADNMGMNAEWSAEYDYPDGAEKRPILAWKG